MFSDELEKISWEETTKIIYSKTDADVRRALSKEHCDVNDFMALISPAAAPYLETMARLSRKYNASERQFRCSFHSILQILVQTRVYTVALTTIIR